MLRAPVRIRVHEMRPENRTNREGLGPAPEEVPSLRRESGANALKACDSVQGQRLVCDRLRRQVRQGRERGSKPCIYSGRHQGNGRKGHGCQGRRVQRNQEDRGKEACKEEVGKRYCMRADFRELTKPLPSGYCQTPCSPNPKTLRSTK